MMRCFGFSRCQRYFELPKQADCAPLSRVAATADRLVCSRFGRSQLLHRTISSERARPQDASDQQLLHAQH